MNTSFFEEITFFLFALPQIPSQGLPRTVELYTIVYHQFVSVSCSKTYLIVPVTKKPL
jgi:hypothetical protein